MKALWYTANGWEQTDRLCTLHDTGQVALLLQDDIIQRQATEGRATGVCLKTENSQIAED